VKEGVGLLVAISPLPLALCRGFRVDLGLPDRQHFGPAVCPRKVLEIGDLFLLLHRHGKLLDVQLEVHPLVAVALLEGLHPLVQPEPGPFAHAHAGEHVVLRVDIFRIGCIGGVQVKEEH
jgi:hypothetical protein